MSKLIKQPGVAYILNFPEGSEREGSLLEYNTDYEYHVDKVNLSRDGKRFSLHGLIPNLDGEPYLQGWNLQQENAERAIVRRTKFLCRDDLSAKWGKK